MANFQITPRSALVEGKELNFSNLFLFHTPIGSSPNQSAITEANATTGLGRTVVHNWLIYDGPGSNATLVARAQGLHTYAGNWQNSFSIVFEVERFKGSTLQVMGISVEEGEWSIVGGTGQFAMANGVIYKRFHEQRSDGNTIELTVHGFCPMLKGAPSLLTKLGPWGGNGGTEEDTTEAAPKGLESITVFSGDVVDSIGFSYVDQAGKKHTAGPWGGPGGSPRQIQLAPSEYVKEVSGTFGDYYGVNVITSLTFVTSLKTHGPFGQEDGTPFTVPVQKNSGIVGFHARGGKFLDAIGVYVRPL